MPQALERSRGTNFRQRGNSLVVALIALTGLGTLGALTASSVQGGLTSVTSERGHAIALLAAESGLAVGLKYLSLPTYDYQPFPQRGFSYVVVPGPNYYDLPGLPGNRAQPGQLDNNFSPSMNAWYDVAVTNNANDPGYFDSTDFEDTDGRIIFRSIGYGPNRATVTLEVEVQYFAEFDPLGPPTPFTYEKFAILSWRELQ